MHRAQVFHLRRPVFVSTFLPPFLDGLANGRSSPHDAEPLLLSEVLLLADAAERLGIVRCEELVAALPTYSPVHYVLLSVEVSDELKDYEQLQQPDGYLLL